MNSERNEYAVIASETDLETMKVATKLTVELRQAMLDESAQRRSADLIAVRNYLVGYLQSVASAPQPVQVDDIIIGVDHILDDVWFGRK